ncbi:MAG TPA: phospholipase D-like domain-containing protein, partial [Verrucomicrobiae bacterium]|nr:phospholipase D-like domain-containing protein [Verrucomicrobiae bacterium]
KTIRLELYIYCNDELGRQFRDLLVRAAERGARVQILIDALGSLGLSAAFWKPVTDLGGEVRWFNPEILNRFSSRDHRKLLICDEEIAFVGGFNMGHSYQGDGVTSGWLELGLRIVSPLAVQLAAAFDEMFARATLQPGKSRRHTTRSVSPKRKVAVEEGELLLSGPGRGRNPFNRSLRRDLKGARNVQIIAAYFLPTWRIRRALLHAAKSGGKVQMILPAKSDVLLSQLACRSLYRRLLRAGVEIYEYQPQILHAKLIIIDDVVYVGSSNLDPRSLYINYELMLRFRKEKLVAEARALFAANLKHCQRIELETWRKSRTWWNRLKQRWAYFLLVRVDPVIARWHSRKVKQ